MMLPKSNDFFKKWNSCLKECDKDGTPPSESRRQEDDRTPICETKRQGNLGDVDDQLHHPVLSSTSMIWESLESSGESLVGKEFLVDGVVFC